MDSLSRKAHGLGRALTFGLIVAALTAVVAVPLFAAENVSATTTTANGYAYGKNALGDTIYKLWVSEAFTYNGEYITWTQPNPTISTWATIGSGAYNSGGYLTDLHYREDHLWSFAAFGHSQYGINILGSWINTGNLYMYDYCYGDGHIYYTGGAGY